MHGGNLTMTNSPHYNQCQYIETDRQRVIDALLVLKYHDLPSDTRPMVARTDGDLIARWSRVRRPLAEGCSRHNMQLCQTQRQRRVQRQSELRRQIQIQIQS